MHHNYINLSVNLNSLLGRELIDLMCLDDEIVWFLEFLDIEFIEHVYCMKKNDLYMFNFWLN